VNLTSFKTSLALFRAEVKKAWGFPILELAVGFVALVSIPTINPLLEATLPNAFQSSFNSLVAETLTMNINSQMLPLTILCGILISLSFARDYEQGLMQTVMSSPVSRSSIFIIKFLAVIIPLTLTSWAVTLLLLVLNFYSDAAAVFTVIQITAWALPITLLALMFYGGLATLTALAIKRTIPAALTSMLLGFSFWFITTLKPESIGDIANYLALTPYKAPLVALSRIFEVPIMPPAPPEALENVLPAWNFLGLTVFYALVFVIPMYLYFTRRFEVRE
jgi:ABC-type transport system involved in multi-copper enzyme maturation permease subunit